MALYASGQGAVWRADEVGRECAAVLAGLLAAGVVLGACSSSTGRHHPSTSTPALSSAQSSDPTPSPTPTQSIAIGVPASPTSTGPTPITEPLPSPTATPRHVVRPPGAKKVDFTTCGQPDNSVYLWIKQRIFGPFGEDDVTKQSAQLPGVAYLAKHNRAAAAAARKIWLRDGYPANFAAVQDLDQYIQVYDRLIATASKNNLDAIPRSISNLRACRHKPTTTSTMTLANAKEERP